MNANHTPQILISFMLMFFVTFTFSQDISKKSIGDDVYREYKQNGIDKAIENYHNLKTNNSGDYLITEWELNRLGYELMDEGDMEAAEKIFNLNMKEYPQAANPRDSYADYLIAKGDTIQARKYLEESVSIAGKYQIEEQKRTLKGSKAKLAKLDNKHKQVDFLTGKWEITGTEYDGDMPANINKGSDEIDYDEELNMFTVTHKNHLGNIMAKRIFVYNAMNDSYDMALVQADAPMGLEISQLKIVKKGNDTYEFIEEFEEDGENKKIKHELKRKADGTMDWVIFEEGQNMSDWKKVYAMDMKKNN